MNRSTVCRSAARLLALCVCAVLIACGLLTGCSKIGDHSEDAKEIQGQWQVVGTMMTCNITENQIRLPGGTVYDYEIDTTNRTITFSVGDVSGEATYELSKDSQLGTTKLTLTEVLDGTETTTTFAKLSDDTSIEPSKTGGVEAFSHDPNAKEVEDSGTGAQGTGDAATGEQAGGDGSSGDTTAEATGDATGSGADSADSGTGSSGDSSGGSEGGSADSSGGAGGAGGSFSNLTDRSA